MGSQEKFIALELIFHGREPELDDFSKEFNNLHWVSKHIRRLGPENIAYSGGSPAELIILAVSVTANILTIADILAKRLANGHESTVRIGKREIDLRGKWKPEEIAEILNTISSKASKIQALKQIAEIKSFKIAETKEELATLANTIHTYERLVETFNDIPKKKYWQKKKAQEYQKKLIELRKEAEHLRSFIDFLKPKD